MCVCVRVCLSDRRRRQSAFKKAAQEAVDTQVIIIIFLTRQSYTKHRTSVSPEELCQVKKDPQVEVFNQAAKGKYRDFNHKLFESSKLLVIGVAACDEPLRKEPALLFKPGTLTYLQRQYSSDAVILTVDIAAPCFNDGFASNEPLGPRWVQRLP